MESVRVYHNKRRIEVSFKGFSVAFDCFGGEILCTSPPFGLNKEDKQYIQLKKTLRNLDYFTQTQTKFPRPFEVKTAEKVLKQIRL